MLVFAEENQGASQWGIRTTGDDPAVERKDFTENPSWELDHDRLSDFLIAFVLWQAVNGGSPAGGVGSTDNRILNELSSWQVYAIAGSHWTDTQFFALDNQLLCLLGSQELSVHAAARDPEAFAAFGATVDVDWDYTWPETDD